MLLKSKRISRGSFLLGISLSIFLVSTYRIIGYIGFAILLISAVFFVEKIYIDTVCKIVLLCELLLIARFLMQLFFGDIYPDTFRSYLIQAFIYLYILLIRNTMLQLKDWKWIFSRYAIVILIIGIYLFSNNIIEKSEMFSSMYGNILLIGFGISLILTHLETNVKGRIFWIIALVLFIFLSYESGMRSAFLGELIGVAFSLYVSLRNNGERINKNVFFMVVLLCFFVPYIYLELYSPSSNLMAEISSFLQLFVLRITSKRFFSGRDILWPYIIDSLNGHQFFGHGIGFNPGLIYDTSFSTHNLFLFLRLEQGIIGLVSFVVLLYTFWINYYKLSRNKTMFFVQGFMVTILIQQTFSLGLVGGKGGFSIACWTVLSAFSKQTIEG